MSQWLKYRVRKFYASIALLSLELVMVLFAFICSFIAVAWVVRRIFLQQKEDLDYEVFDVLSRYVNESTTSIMQFITFFGSHNFLIPANLILIAYFLFIKKHKWYSIKVPAVGLSSLLLMFSLKFIFNRPRPLFPLLENVNGLSFPSGHAFMSFSFFGLLVYLTWKYVHNRFVKWLLITGLFIFIFLIGLSRIYLKVHYASDVLAGLCLGLIWLVISLWILRKMEKYSLKKITPQLDKTPG